MSGASYIIDTNIISYFLKGNKELSPYFNFTQVYISFITELELLSIPGLSINESAQLKAFLETCFIIDINLSIKQLTVLFRKNYKLKLPDAIIAATASFLGYPLVT